MKTQFVRYSLQADPAHLNAPRMEDINAEMCLLNFHFIHDLCVPQPVEVSPSNITTTGRTQPLEVTLSPVQKMEHQRLLEQAAASGYDILARRTIFVIEYS